MSHFNYQVNGAGMITKEIRARSRMSLCGLCSSRLPLVVICVLIMGSVCVPCAHASCLNEQRSVNANRPKRSSRVPRLYRRDGSKEQGGNDAAEARNETTANGLIKESAEDRNQSIAETAFAEGEALRAEWRAESFRLALTKYSISRQHWHANGSKQKEASVLNIMGEIHLTLSEYHKSLSCYNEALALNRSMKNRLGEIEALNNISSIHIYLGEGGKAQSYASRALRLSRNAVDTRGEAHALNNIGEAYYFSGEIQKALEIFRSSLSVWPKDAPQGRAQTLMNIGYAYFDLRDVRQALEYYNQSLKLWQALDDRRHQALALTAIGGAYFYLGEKQMALDFHARAVHLFRIMGDRNGEAVALNGLGYVYNNLGEYQKALDCYSQALNLFRQTGNREYENFTIIYVGSSYQFLGETEKALEYYKLLLNRPVNYSQAKASALVHIGEVYISTKELHQALDHFQRALKLYRAIGDKTGEAATLNEIGSTFSLLDEKKSARDYYKKALLLSRKVRDQEGEALALFNIARLERDTGNLAEALSQIEIALKIIEPLRRKVSSQDLRSSYFASVHNRYELYIDILMLLHQQHPTEGFDTRALRASEQARARSLLEMLSEAHADISQGVDPELLERARILQQALDNQINRRRTLLGSEGSAEFAAVTKELDKLTTEYDEVNNRIRAASPHYFAVTQPEPLSLPEIQQQVLDEHTLLLEYKLGEDRSYLWAVTRNGISSYELPARPEIEREAIALYKLLTAHHPEPGETFEQRRSRIAEADARYWQQAAALSQTLLGPVADQLGTKRLLIVADGVLQYIPFQALTSPETADERRGALARIGSDASSAEPVPLMLEHEVVNQPSASALAVIQREMSQRAPAPKAVAVLADPVFERDDPRVRLATEGVVAPEQSERTEISQAMRDVAIDNNQGSIPRLFASRAEAESIREAAPRGEILEALGFEASRTTAMNSELRQYRIIHFATHGLLDSKRPELSGILLSLVDEQGRPQDGFLRLQDIYNLNLPADLVVLSACNTGLGKSVKGEGLIGLTRGFMYAGAASVMASLWKVDDEATAEFMKHFYRTMLKEGRPPAAALREAQLSIWQQKRWRAPYYWAAFVLQGDYQGRSSLPQPYRVASGKGYAVTFGVALALTLLWRSLYTLRRRRKRRMRPF
jgi:CHAT domain-containing protein/lipopolysaccharide biosynthesis regulator YciM